MMSLAPHLIHFCTGAEQHSKPVSSLHMLAIWVQAAHRSTALLYDKSSCPAAYCMITGSAGSVACATSQVVWPQQPTIHVFALCY